MNLLLFAVMLGQQPIALVRMAESWHAVDTGGRRVRSYSGKVDALSVDRAASVAVGVEKLCGYYGGGRLFLLEAAGRTALAWPKAFLPGVAEPGDIEVFAEPAVAPSGRYVAFVARSCSWTRELDAIEASGVVVLLDRGTGVLAVMAGSVGVDGAPEGYANRLTWSHDEAFVFVNFELGFRVLRVSDGSVAADYPGNRNELWSNALGWIGSRCVVFIEGKEHPDAVRNPRLVLNIATGETARLGLFTKGEIYAGDVAWPWVLAGESGGFTLTHVGPLGLTTRALGRAREARLLFGEPAAGLPEFCR